ncbi:MAG: beta-N-acetylhexosaminidase [Clostridia bacterium]|nr:beta-N-acetylhexosaminidase [Clostridia bacterium]
MRICFQNADSLADGIAILAKELGIEVACPCSADVMVEVEEASERTLAVTLDGKKASIAYGDGRARFFRGLAMLVNWVKKGETKKSIAETPLFKTNGAMVDMSRNGVMNVPTVKSMLRKMALMGMNMYMLYTEDTYEIEEYPFFGYMRGRYTKDEIREIDAYAIKLGIELIPCIQVLGHLSTHLWWPAAAPYCDTAEVMLVGEQATYDLIAKMIKTVKECFTSRRIHVGMDETTNIGLGKYLKKNGFREQQDIYFEHLAKVIDMMRTEGLEPMMWSDMFFRLAGKDLEGYSDYDMRVEFTDEVIKKIPKGIQQVFWDYYQSKEEFYAVNIDKHQRIFGRDSLFAGGIWTWSGYGPLFSRSVVYSKAALDACRKAGVEEVFATIWHNGAEGSLFLALAGLAWYADYDYNGSFDVERAKGCFAMACGACYDDLAACEAIEHPDGSDVSASRALLYNDPLIGLVDAHVKLLPDVAEYYKDVSAKLAKPAADLAEFAPAYDLIRRVSELMENKADFGVRLKAAYDGGDRKTLSALVAECDVIIEKLRALSCAHKKAWMTYNKPFGWEIHDMRYGTLIARFETAKERVLAYLDGTLGAIEELEAERLRYDGATDSTPFHGDVLWYNRPFFFSASQYR